jgi:RNA-directed DNA polymerase
MRDRLIQQMMKQILEPICEAKFHPHSYGFRPNRSTSHAMARCQHLINHTHNHTVVDIDIQGFFDNVNHTKLLKQMYTLGICDKRVLAIVSKMLKAPIQGVGNPKKGTPQGGILSPLLSNIVLNDLDWWIHSQWEGMKTEYPYGKKKNKILMLKKKSSLKEMYIVRYADDFKVFTNSFLNAQKIFYAIQGYLKNHLTLDISKEKSTITNLRKRASDFLGFTLKTQRKRNRYVAYTHIAPKKVEHIVQRARKLVKAIQKHPKAKTAMDYNVFIMGIHNYYRIATRVNIDCVNIAYRLSRTLYNRLKSIGKYGIPERPTDTFKSLYKNKFKTYEIQGVHLSPIADVQMKVNLNFKQQISNYTKSGRETLYKALDPIISREIHELIKQYREGMSVEYFDNRISRYSMQKGKCAVTGQFLRAEDMHCHHKQPKYMEGSDAFDNLTIVHTLVHKLIHATKPETIQKYLQLLQLDDKQLKKVNQFRKVCKLDPILQS